MRKRLRKKLLRGEFTPVPIRSVWFRGYLVPEEVAADLAELETLESRMLATNHLTQIAAELAKNK